jgi:hypothetical protein
LFAVVHGAATMQLPSQGNKSRVITPFLDHASCASHLAPHMPAASSTLASGVRPDYTFPTTYKEETP